MVLRRPARDRTLLSTNYLNCHSSIARFIAFRFLAGSQDFGSHVAAGLGPFIALLSRHSADETDDDGPAGENAHPSIW